MKSFVAYPSALQKVFLHQTTQRSSSGELLPHFELYKRVKSISGSIVKCGIAAEEGFTRFSMFKDLIACNPYQKMVAFEKITNHTIESAPGSLQSKIDSQSIDVSDIYQSMLEKAEKANIDFSPGHVDDAIPDYLIANPELKIAYLDIDLDDYESTITALEFLYPRLVQGGILILDNYYKKTGEFKAATDYFAGTRTMISSFSVNNGPHYLIRY